MKPLPAALAVTLVTATYAQTSSLPAFAPGKMDLPALSLRNAIAANDSALEPRLRPPGALAQPHTFLERAALIARPKSDEKSGPRMRVIAPDSTVDYKMRIVEARPDLDPKMIVDPGSSSSSDSTK